MDCVVDVSRDKGGGGPAEPVVYLRRCDRVFSFAVNASDESDNLVAQLPGTVLPKRGIVHHSGVVFEGGVHVNLLVKSLFVVIPVTYRPGPSLLDSDDEIPASLTASLRASEADSKN